VEKIAIKDLTTPQIVYVAVQKWH